MEGSTIASTRFYYWKLILILKLSLSDLSTFIYKVRFAGRVQKNFPRSPVGPRPPRAALAWCRPPGSRSDQKQVRRIIWKSWKTFPNYWFLLLKAPFAFKSTIKFYIKVPQIHIISIYTVGMRSVVSPTSPRTVDGDSQRPENSPKNEASTQFDKRGVDPGLSLTLSLSLSHDWCNTFIDW